MFIYADKHRRLLRLSLDAERFADTWMLGLRRRARFFGVDLLRRRWLVPQHLHHSQTDLLASVHMHMHAQNFRIPVAWVLAALVPHRLPQVGTSTVISSARVFRITGKVVALACAGVHAEPRTGWTRNCDESAENVQLSVSNKCPS